MDRRFFEEGGVCGTGLVSSLQVLTTDDIKEDKSSNPSAAEVVFLFLGEVFLDLSVFPLIDKYVDSSQTLSVNPTSPLPIVKGSCFADRR